MIRYAGVIMLAAVCAATNGAETSGAETSGAETIPAKTVVLTFDDAVKSHRTFVAPLLAELGFGATFFVTHLWMDDTEQFMSWAQIAEIHGMGFEIGNHTWTHLALNQPAGAARLAGELALVEYELARVGVPKPLSFAWPGNAFGPEAREVLAEAGYRFARRGMQPEIPYGEIVQGPAYDPAHHDALLIPSAGDAYPEWTLDHFKEVVAQAIEGRAVVLQFHGVPDVAHPWVHTEPERFEAFMRYLKNEGFNVIAMRGLERYLPEEPAADAKKWSRFPELANDRLVYSQEYQATRDDLTTWFDDIQHYFGFTAEEITKTTGLTGAEQFDRILRSSSFAWHPRVVPYPGGRHPRIGFQEGAVNPQRGTKAGVVPRWIRGGYAVVDLPEAIFSNLGLIFLAHTHIPTIWDEQDIYIENTDWTRNFNHSLSMQRTLPNEITFGSDVRPHDDGADLELWLTNGTDAPLTDLRTQVCVMLKGLKGFEAQTNENKRFAENYAAALNATGDRWIAVTFEGVGRVWGNAPCPCIHADPVLPDAAPGETVRAKGKIRFYEGEDPSAIMNGASGK